MAQQHINGPETDQSDSSEIVSYVLSVAHVAIIINLKSDPFKNQIIVLQIYFHLASNTQTPT